MNRSFLLFEDAPEGTPRLQPWVSKRSTTIGALAPGLCLSFPIHTSPSSPTLISSLQTLANPNAALLLILTGLFLIYAELNRPGTILVGCCGVFATTLGIYSLAQHPVHLTSLLLLLTCLTLLLLEFKLRTPTLLALAATLAISCSLATLTLPRIHPLLALATGTLFTAVTLLLLRIARRARQNKRLGRNPAPNLQPSRNALAE